ncbi:C5-sterol desaturase [Fistulina hepatica ATCC 64428]|nr:C5-sterol desaturase [Fistulina hepatica ATCC 64428]
MDFVLAQCNEYFLDKVWAALVPLSAFVSSPEAYETLNATSLVPSKYLQLVSTLPHPPLPESLTAIQATTISAWPRDYMPRQLLSVFVITLIGIHVLYFSAAWFSYTCIFNHDIMRHPKFLKDQVKLEIMCSIKAFPVMTILTLPWFEAEILGYSKLYDGPDTYGWPYFFFSILLYLLFTDFGIYWAHRWLHWPTVYKLLHKPHHKWIIPTPFASHAFHPVDGYLQSVPYHLFIFVFPMHRLLYLSMFGFVNFWSILIHDSDMITGHPLEKIINGPAHHTLHHMYFTVNFGQYFTWADRTGNSYRQPLASDDPLVEVYRLDKLKGAKTE